MPRPCLRHGDLQEVQLQVLRDARVLRDPTSDAIIEARAPDFAPELRAPGNGDEWRYLFFARIALDAGSVFFLGTHTFPLLLSTFALLPFAAPPSARTPWRFWFAESLTHLVADATLSRWASFALTLVAMGCYYTSVRAGASCSRSRKG